MRAACGDGVLDTCNDAFHHCAGTTNFGDTAFLYGPPAGYVALP